MVFDVEGAHLKIADLHSDWVLARLEHGLHHQSARSRCATDERYDGVPGAQRHAGPVAADLAEQAMLNRVPLATAGGIVAHSHGQSETIADLDLQALLPGSDLTPVAATGIGQ